MTASTLSAPAARTLLPTADRWPVLASLGAFLLGGVFIADAVSLRQALLFLIGGLLGIVLYHAAFGFTGGWRAFILERRGAGLRAQMLMLAIASAFFLPLLAGGSAFGQPLVGAIAPVGLSVVIGAFVFGFGMQLGGGCGSGTLFTVGGGSTRMLLTLGFFIVGAVIGTAHIQWWLALPSLGAISLGAEFGVLPTLVGQWVVLAAVAGLTLFMEQQRNGDVVAARRMPAGPESMTERLFHGPWPVIWGAVALALLNVVTLVAAGHPWSITFAFGLWGAKALAAFGVDIASWPFWSAPGPAMALNQSVLADTVSVLDFGLILGAMLAAGLAGRYAPRAKLPLGSAAAAIVGGLLMGYGARLSFGCNIGALFSGIASGSLHGWVWFAAAFAGSIIGVRARPLFGLHG